MKVKCANPAIYFCVYVQILAFVLSLFCVFPQRALVTTDCFCFFLNHRARERPKLVSAELNPRTLLLHAFSRIERQWGGKAC